MIQPIPKELLPSSMKVWKPKDGDMGGEYEAEPIDVKNVRYESVSTLKPNRYLLTDGASGIVYVDAINSEGAFAIPEGSLIAIDDAPKVSVLKVSPLSGFDSVHHWEVQVG